MRIIAEGQHSGRRYIGLERQPFLRPKKAWVLVFRPCLLARSPQSVHKDNIDCMRGIGHVNDVETKRIIRGMV